MFCIIEVSEIVRLKKRDFGINHSLGAVTPGLPLSRNR